MVCTIQPYKAIWFTVIGLTLIASGFTSSVSAGVLTTGQLIGWGCPPPPTGAPTPAGDGSILYVHVVDMAGNDFEVRCVPTIGGWHYEYHVSFPDGTRKEISRCIYSLGLNDLSIVYNGAMSRVVAPGGTPVINVGSLVVVEHSNIQGTWPPATMKPKPGGKDFHMVYDYKNKFRYRLNTIVGKGATDTDYFASRSYAPAHSILHAEESILSSPSDYESALASDTKFRQIDDADAVPPCDECSYQTADVDSSPIGYVFLEDDTRRGGIIMDQGMHGSSFTLQPAGITGFIPPGRARSRTTMAFSRSLFEFGANELLISVDGKRVRDAKFRSTDTMIVVDITLSGDSHTVQVTEKKLRKKQK